MRLKFRKYCTVLGVSIAIILLAGCAPLESLRKRINLKNEYFEFVNSNNVKKITVQSSRDKGFKFIVTEGSAINDMYTLLSKSKVSEEKTSLDPDYIFEFDLGDEKREFYYIVGTDEGNFYNDELVFSVSKRLDEGIMQNLSFIRTPRDFEYVYYNSILGVIEALETKMDNKSYKVGINIQGDVDCLKYVYSIELEKFIKDAKKIVPNIELVNNNESNFDLVLTVKNRGYDSTNFKTNISVNNKVEKVTDEYYIVAVNEFKEWNIKISEANKKPNGW